MILSSLVLNEGISSWLEWVGVGLMIVTISVYLVQTRKWMDDRRAAVEQQVEKVEEDVQTEEEVQFGDEELVSVPRRENTLLLPNMAK